MGLFDVFKKEKDQEQPESITEEKDVEAIGWQAIEQEFLRVYPGQDNTNTCSDDADFICLSLAETS